MSNNEVTVQAPQTTLTATQVRALLGEVERKEQAAKTLTVKDVKPGQYFQFTQGILADGRTRLMLKSLYDWSAGQYYVRIPMSMPSALYKQPVILVRNFDGEAL